MLCCVSRKSVDGPGFKRPPLVPTRGISLTNSTSISTSSLTSTNTKSKCLPLCTDANLSKLERIVDKDELAVLLPCAICGRTFKPQSLDKHTRICERSAIKKRKPFDSSKQRIQGTELEEFLPKEIKKRNYEERSFGKTSWKQSHDEFIKTIRAARGESVEPTPSRQLAPIIAPGAPTRANEKGICPTCNRQFGIKAYDRHVAWCKDRVTRMPSSPATNMAKERLDARMKYRAPMLKNRRMTNRDKYSSSHFKNPSASLKPKKTVSLPSCGKTTESGSLGLKQSTVPARKIGQERNEGLVPVGPVKSRLSDRSTTRSINDDTSPTLSPPQPSQKSPMNMNPQNPAKASRGSNIINSSNPRNAKADDVTIESYVIDTTGQPCCVDDDLNESRNSNVLITWRQIASVSGSFDDKHPEWIRSVQKLDQTYLIKESNDFLDSSKNLLPENTDYPPSTSLAAGKIIPVEKSGIIDANEKSEITLSLPKPVTLSRSLKIIPIPPININDVMMTTDSLDSASSNEISVKKRLRRKMNLLRESTDSLVSSFDTSIDNAHAGNSVDKFQVFPSIGGDQRHSICQGRRKVSYWERAVRNTRNRFIPLAQRQVESTKNPLILPPVVPAHQRSSEEDKRPAWSDYIRRRPDFNLILKGRTGISPDYDPFLRAEQQMLDLLSDTYSDQSFPDSPATHKKSPSPNYPLPHSSAFAKYPNITPDNRKTDKRGSLIAPPTEFDDLSTDFSSDSTETNSISRELFIDRNQANKNNNNQPILGRRIIIDKSKALGQVSDVFGEAIDTKSKETTKKNDRVSPAVVKSHINRSNSVRAASAPKIPERNNPSSLSNTRANSRSNSGSGMPSRNNNYSNLGGSNLSLTSIISSEVELKHSNSVFEDLVSSFEDDVSGSFPSLRSLLKNDSFSSPIQPSRNGQISDEDLSSPDSYHKKDYSKLSADSAYSSLNRKYSNGRSTNDVAGKLDGHTPLRHRDVETSSLKSKMSKFCHECGTKFPETAKFCCECGVQRLAI